MVQNCRFYEKKYPDVGDIVKVRVNSIQDMGAYAHLLEYNNIDGMIPMSELSRKRIRSLHKLIRVGRVEAVVVLRVDEQKGYIDLSKKRATDEEIAAVNEKFLKAKQVNDIMRNVADAFKLDMEKLCDETCWKLARKYGDMYTAFKMAYAKPEILDECAIEDKIKRVLLSKITHHMKPQPVKIVAKIAVSCYSYEGVDAIVRALQKGIACSTENVPISIKLDAAPHYILSTITEEMDEGMALFQKAFKAIEEDITAAGGVMVVKDQPTIPERDGSGKLGTLQEDSDVSEDSESE